ncbi:MAG: ATP-binding protein [Scrofimicrobium sp.]
MGSSDPDARDSLPRVYSLFESPLSDDVIEEARTELMAQERLASLGSLSAGVAHELNNPVAAIERVGEYLADDVIALLETAPDRKWAALAISALTDGLESIALSSRQERELRKEFTSATGDGATAMRLTLGGIRDPKLARKAAKGSEIELESVLQTTENSEETEEDLGLITIRTLSPRPGWVRVQIADDGPGVPRDILPRIFEPRFTTKSGQVRFGMGIGLSVSRTIIGRHYGTMRIDTGESGTTVTVDIPTKAPKEQQ